MLAPRRKLWSVDPAVLDAALDMLSLTSEDTFVDLGCGNGKTVVAAHQKYGCKSIGVEVYEPRAKEAMALVSEQCPGGQATVVCANALEADLSATSAMYLYLIERGLKAVALRVEESARVLPKSWAR